MEVPRALPAGLHEREIMYETGLVLRAVQRELENLASLGLVKIQKTRNKVYYEINRNSPLFKPFKEICGLIPGAGK